MARIPMMKPRIATMDTRTALPPPKQRASHYATAEHVTWSKEVVRRAGGRCQGRGCVRSGIRLFADHIVELKDGGAPLDVTNGQALCGSCHTRKTAAARASRQWLSRAPA